MEIKTKSGLPPHWSEGALFEVRFLQIQGVIESCTDILTMSYWLHVELEIFFFKFDVKK
jgi:hypothetical protein